jgi:hypothetical protein
MKHEHVRMAARIAISSLWLHVLFCGVLWARDAPKVIKDAGPKEIRGGGEVTRDELTAAKRSGKDVRVFPADMNHALAREKALKRGQPVPTDFRGAAGTAFAKKTDR